MRPRDEDDDDPSPTSGRPYYCVHCKKGYDDYLKCEDLDCELETDNQAQARIQQSNG